MSVGHVHTKLIYPDSHTHNSQYSVWCLSNDYLSLTLSTSIAPCNCQYSLVLLLRVYLCHLNNCYSLSLDILIDIHSLYSSLLCLNLSSLHLSELSIGGMSTHMYHSVIYWQHGLCQNDVFIHLKDTCFLLFCSRCIWLITNSCQCGTYPIIV